MFSRHLRPLGFRPSLGLRLLSIMDSLVFIIVLYGMGRYVSIMFYWLRLEELL
jgi:hypothetical protein